MCEMKIIISKNVIIHRKLIFDFKINIFRLIKSEDNIFL